MRGYDTDLFGEPPAIPGRRTREYRAYLAELELPAGLSYWALAPDCLAAELQNNDFAECIWCVDQQGRFVRLIIDLRTGKQWGK